MAVRLTILGSGSSGNCAYVETDETRILVDAGFSARQIRQRLATIGRSPENLTGILITHEHADHIAGLLALADKLKIPIYCNRATQEATLWTFKAKWSSSKSPALPGLDGSDREHRDSFQPSLFSLSGSQPVNRTAPVQGRSNANSQAGTYSSNAGTSSPSPVGRERAGVRAAVPGNGPPRLDWRLFRTGDSFELNDIMVETFSIPHDAQDPVGFVLRVNGTCIGFATDLGHVTKLVVDRLRTANVLVLEANHDVKMLQECPHRPWSLKQRILGRHGHLSNEAAADCVEQIMTPDLRNLYLGHLSRECNRPEIAHRVVNHRLQKISAGHVTLSLASQDIPCPTLTL